MKKELILFPKYFGPNIQDLLVEKLIASVEGSCSGRYGFVVCVTDVIDVGKGRIREGGCPRRRPPTPTHPSAHLPAAPS